MNVKANIRLYVVIILMAALFGAIAALFWYNEYVYSLPTPVPPNYKAVAIGQDMKLAGITFSKPGKPLFLHFFNPDCPCSKFNIPHFKSLVKNYGKEVSFAIVVMSGKHYSPAQIQKRFDIDIPVLSDTSLAAQCGVYSTPQAVIIDTDKKLFFRGNYNRSRYCTSAKSNYAQQALDGLVQHRNAAAGLLAQNAYGCQLPAACSKQ